MKIKNKQQESVIDNIGICFWDGTYTNKQKKGSTEVTFADYIDSVKNPDDEYIQKVELIRKVKQAKDISEVRKLQINKRILGTQTNKDKVYAALKWKATHVYPSCRFDGEGCKNTNVTSVSGLMVYDIQRITPDIAKQIRTWKYTVCLHKSIGGDNGDYALFLYCPGVTVDSYSGMWERGDKFIQENFGLKPTNSDETKDVTRIRYLSYDPDCFYNPFAEPILITDIVIDTHFNEVQRENIDTLLNSEPMWHKFGLALAVSKGEEGRALYHVFSQQNKQKYSEKTVNNKYDRLLKDAQAKRANGYTAATLLYMLKEMGIKYAAPKTAGAKNIIDGKAEELTVTEVLEFLNSNWVRNEITDGIINFKTGQETNVESVWTEFQVTFNDPAKTVTMIHTLLRSERMNTINPIKNFFDEAKQTYDGKKYIDQYVGSLPLINPEAAGVFIRYWMINAYLQAVHNVTNRSFLIFKGTEEIGKSRALIWLCPLDGYLKTGPLNTDSKDTRIALAHNFLWSDDELKVFRTYDINKIKALISTDVINERSPYARSSETLKRICSFCGSTNADEILPATEGNTRFLIVELKPGVKVNWQTYMAIDKHKIWGEAISLHEGGWLDKNRAVLNSLRNTTNEGNTINTSIQDAIMATLENTSGDKVRTIMSLKEICEAIDPDGRLGAFNKENLVREIISKQFGNGRVMGIRSDGQRRPGYSCRIKSPATIKQLK